MTRPIHTVKYIQATYRKYQILAIVCAILTITAALLSALSGIEARSLRKAKLKSDGSAAVNQAQVNAAASQALEEARRQLAETQEKLASERDNLKAMSEKMTTLERQLSEAEAKVQKLEGTPKPQPSPAPHTAPAPPPPVKAPNIGPSSEAASPASETKTQVAAPAPRVPQPLAPAMTPPTAMETSATPKAVNQESKPSADVQGTESPPAPEPAAGSERSKTAPENTPSAAPTK